MQVFASEMEVAVRIVLKLQYRFIIQFQEKERHPNAKTQQMDHLREDATDGGEESGYSTNNISNAMRIEKTSGMLLTYNCFKITLK